MGILFKRLIVGHDFAQCYFKRDIPCFQFSGFLRDDRAGKPEMKQLLKAIVNLGDWADAVTLKLSDHYPAQHGLAPLKPLRTATMIRLPISPVDLQTYIKFGGTNVFEVPAVWYQAGQTQTAWGRLESAVREAIRLSEG